MDGGVKSGRTRVEYGKRERVQKKEGSEERV